MTGINIPDMIKIVEEHGCVAVPFDFNIDTMQPSNLEDIKALTTDKVTSEDRFWVLTVFLPKYRPRQSSLLTSLVSHTTSAQFFPSAKRRG